MLFAHDRMAALHDNWLKAAQGSATKCLIVVAHFVTVGMIKKLA